MLLAMARVSDADRILNLLFDELNRQTPTVSVAMSGGVDSSVTLSLVQQSLSLPSSSITLTCPTTSSPLPHLRLKSNISLSSVFMRNWSPQTNEDSSLNPATVTNHPDTACEWEKDFQDVQQVSYKLGLAKEDIRLVDLSREYWLDVFEPSVEVWEDGGTPNPDVGCNRWVAEFIQAVARTLIHFFIVIIAT